MKKIILFMMISILSVIGLDAEQILLKNTKQLSLGAVSEGRVYIMLGVQPSDVTWKWYDTPAGFVDYLASASDKNWVIYLGENDAFRGQKYSLLLFAIANNFPIMLGLNTDHSIAAVQSLPTWP